MKDRNYWKERLPLIHAYVDGHDIQASNGVCKSYDFDAYPHTYTILPKPDPYKKFKNALMEGKTIQVKVYGTWRDCDFVFFDSSPEHYRIKPEPKLVPFNEDDAIYGRWIMQKDLTCVKAQILKQHDRGVTIPGNIIPYDILLKAYCFEDGTPCGKYVECE